MSNTDCLGLIFPNVHDDRMFEMTEYRSIASVPFAARYRIIDFSLSMLVNAGITKVGVLARSNYRSLMDHLGTGKPWDLDRKHGGLFILPPFAFGEGTYTGHIDALYNAMNFIRHSTQEYVVLCDCDVIANFPLDDMVRQHIRSGADITVAYRHGPMPQNAKERMVITMNKENRVQDIAIGFHGKGECDYGLGITVMKKERLMEMVDHAVAHSQNSITRDLLQANVGTLGIFGYEVTGYAEVVDGPDAYFRISNELLTDSAKRHSLFTTDRPILTKTRDDMPTKYGLDSSVSTSLIGDGCIIEGKVVNSIIFRGVHIEKGTVVENCIIMQDSFIGENAVLKNVTIDKDVTVSKGLTLSGAAGYPMYIRKGTTV